MRLQSVARSWKAFIPSYFGSNISHEIAVQYSFVSFETCAAPRSEKYNNGNKHNNSTLTDALQFNL
jgi:hypothetical protein